MKTKNENEETEGCDCQDFKNGGVSNECPIHNLHPAEPPARPARSRSGRHDLGCHHCQEVLDRELLIGADSERGKRFTFHVLRNEYRVHHLGKVVDSGQAVEELLEVYNRI
tara:strand:+ start:4979 stop:5311 length:333 start_codon:yes stop_codon:yes gene_type:complete